MKNRSKSHFLRLSIVAAFMLGGAYLYSLSQKMRDLKNSPIVSSLFQKIDPAKKLSEQAMQFNGVTQAKLSDSEKADEGCRTTLESIEMLPINALIEDLKSDKINLNKECLFKSLSSQSANLVGFPEICTFDKNQEIPQECSHKLFIYKSLRIHHNTQSDDIKGLSTEILLQKFFGMLTEEAFAKPDGATAFRQTTNELHERLPESASAAKASIIGYLVDGNLSDSDQEKFDESLTQARNKFPNDWDIYEISLVRKRLSDENAFRQDILDYYSSRPDSAIANYYMGCVQWSSGNSKPAQQYFKQATTIAPTDVRFKETYEKSLANNTSDQVCTVKVNFNMEGF